MVQISAGKILIADPFLKDPNFKRSVVIVCEHQDSGSFGFVLNKLYEQVLGDLIADLEGSTFPVYYGGPVQLDTIHFLHRCPELISGGFEISEGIFWGGDFEEVADLIKADRLRETDIRFFIGYSGWGEGQLEEEMKLKSWITSKATPPLIFPTNANNIWKDALKELGGEYELMTNYPIDPQLN
jgi:putative transcriptional regulator